MTMLRILFATLLFAGAAVAAEPRYPPGARIGLVAPKDMQPSKRFVGFEDPVKAAAITIVEMPKEAFAELDKGVTIESLKAQGFSAASREEITLGERKAILFAGEQAAGSARFRKWLMIADGADLTAFVVAQAMPDDPLYADADMRGALMSLTVRAPLSLREQLAALPFKVSDEAGFRAVRAGAATSLFLTDGPKDVVAEFEQPVVLVTQANIPVPPVPQRETLARQALAAQGTFKDMVFERSQAFRQRGADWHEIVARATDTATGKAIVVTQTLRFGPEGLLRMVGMVRAEDRDAALPRFRRLFDSVEPK